MSWNYRLMRWGSGEDEVVAVHEVHYDENGEVGGWTEDPCQFVTANPSEMLSLLVMVAGACEKPILDARTGKVVMEVQ